MPDSEIENCSKSLKLTGKNYTQGRGCNFQIWETSLKTKMFLKNPKHSKNHFVFMAWGNTPEINNHDACLVCHRTRKTLHLLFSGVFSNAMKTKCLSLFLIFQKHFIFHCSL